MSDNGGKGYDLINRIKPATRIDRPGGNPIE